jgi:hypothetical protein
VRLAREADATARKIIRLTWVLVWLTVVLILVTLLLLAKEAYQLCEDEYLDQERGGETTQNTRIPKTGLSPQLSQHHAAKPAVITSTMSTIRNEKALGGDEAT